MGLFCADFETTKDINDCRVWAYSIIEIGNYDNFIYGNNIDSFMNFCSHSFENHTLYFHNLKFDIKFILYWLFRNGYEHIENRKDRKNKTFETLITDKGVFYSITIYFKVRGKKVNKVTIYDSLKILNFSIDQIAKDFKLSINKLKIDYEEYREENHVLTKEEIEYIRNDVEIDARALEIMFNQGMDKMTIGSDALAQFKKLYDKESFNTLFPKPNYDKDVRDSYKGGWTFLHDTFKNKTVGDGIVLDVNSLYPSVMYYEKMPYGEPIYYEGKYKDDPKYPLYIQKFSCMFELKKDHLPTIQIKHSTFHDTEYLKSSIDETGVMQEVTLTLTSVDLKLFLDHYNVYNIDYIAGYKFMATDKLFKEYISYWIEQKIKAKNEGNSAMYIIAKLMLNSLYGKFAVNPRCRSKIPYYDSSNDKIKWRYGEYEERDPLYIPVGTFITSYARNKTIRSAQTVYDRFIYADTDSLHLVGTECPEGLEIDDNKLGAWKIEFQFDKGKYLRQKCYMEHGKDPFEKDSEPYTKITCAGMPKECKKYVTFENFHIGSTFEGKLMPVEVSGGTVLLETTFTIKE